VIALSIGATSLAHGVHYAVLGVGFVGLLALLGPQLVPGRRASVLHDDHDRRVQAVAAAIADGSLGVRTTPAVPSRRPAGSGHPISLVRARYLPVAVVSSAAAAGVHAAVGPAHFREQLLFGLFFAGSAVAQIGWSVAMVTRPTRALLVAAVVGNSAVLALWLTTRTVGLPGLLPTPEAFGPWDLCCAAWELVVVLSAAHVLHADDPQGLRLPDWSDWERVVRAGALVSALVLLCLTLIGAGS
jgi:hypothetical protein